MQGTDGEEGWRRGMGPPDTVHGRAAAAVQGYMLGVGLGSELASCMLAQHLGSTINKAASESTGGEA